jgi:hypothetical protein
VKPARRKSAETAKKTQKKDIEIDIKVIRQNTKTKTGMEEAGEEEKGWGVSSLGTSSKLLESNAKETLGGGMALLPCNYSVLGEGVAAS